MPDFRLVLPASSVSPAAVELCPALPAAARTGASVMPLRLCQFGEHVPAPFPGPPAQSFLRSCIFFPPTIVLDGAPVFLSSKCPSMSPLPLPCTSPFDSRSPRSAILSFHPSGSVSRISCYTFFFCPLDDGGCWIPSSVLWLFGLNTVLSRGLLEISPVFLCGLA